MLNITPQGKGPGFILRFIFASNERLLELKMLKVQLRLKGAVRWRTPYINPINNKIYSWYEVDIDHDDDTKALERAVEENENV